MKFITINELKQIRKARGISQFKLSRQSGISRYNISLIESGYREISPDEMSKIFKVLNVVQKDKAEL